MAKKFYAVNRKTGEKWKRPVGQREYLVMYDSGYLAVVSEGDYYMSITPLDPKIWEKVMVYDDNHNIKNGNGDVK